jgi:site-specific recombinase XerD
MTATIIPIGEEAAGWERALYAFLAEKERRSGSRRTVEGYSRTLQHFFGAIDKSPDRITSQDIFAWAYGKGLSGKEPSQITIGSRLACLSSFYCFLIRMEIVSFNPCDPIERPRVSPCPPRGISADGIRKLLSVIPSTPSGLRDKAIILTLVLTGRRRAEVFNLKVGDLIRTDGLFYTYRGKGGKQGKRELPLPAFEAIQTALAAFGKDLDEMDPQASLWPIVGLASTAAAPCALRTAPSNCPLSLRSVLSTVADAGRPLTLPPRIGPPAARQRTPLTGADGHCRGDAA